jgi:hypothetical protein
MLHQRLDKRGIFTVPQRLGIETQIDIQRADVGHLLIVQQEPP